MINSAIFEQLKQKHRRSLIISSLLAIFGLLSLSGGGIYFYAAHTEAEASLLKLKREQSKYHKASKTFNELKDIFDDFSRLQAIGFIGDEKRLNWVETLNQIVKEEELPKAEFHAMKRRNIKVDGFNKLDDVYISYTQMTLYLLHEKDLYRFYQRLHQEIDGLFIPTHCEVTQLDANTQKRLDYPANLSAECGIEWFSVQLSEKTSTALDELPQEAR